MCVCCVAYIEEEQDINNFINQNPDYVLSGDIPPNNNVTISNFALGVGTSFVPFFSIIDLAFLDLDIFITIFITIILLVISSLQAFLIVTIILNMLPFFNV